MVWQTFLAWFGLYLTLVSINWKTCSSEMNRVEINRVWKIFKEKGSKPFVVCEINALWKEHCDSLFTNPNQTLYFYTYSRSLENVWLLLCQIFTLSHFKGQWNICKYEIKRLSKLWYCDMSSLCNALQCNDAKAFREH